MDVIMCMMKRGFLIAILIIAVALSMAPGAALASDWTPLGGVVMSVPVVYDQQSGLNGAGVDINIIIAFLNAGINYRHWESSDTVILGWDGSDISRDETTMYFGLGLLNMLQVQAGYSESGASLRVRSDMVLFADSFPMFPSRYKDCPDNLDYRQCNDIDIVRDGVVISPFIEFTPFEGNHKTVYGIGVGFVF